MPVPLRPSRNYTPDAPSEPGDERRGEWSRQQLLDMDARFCAVMQWVHGSRRSVRMAFGAGCSNRIVPSRSLRSRSGSAAATTRSDL
jgi:hypothetical protein